MHVGPSRARTLDDLPMLPQTRRVQFVVKTSKFCNLRCKYCYEFLELGDRRAISADQAPAHVPLDRRALRRRRPRHHCGIRLAAASRCCWTRISTGAPSTTRPGSSMTRRSRWWNSVQTNLTVLNDRLLKLLREGFDSVGVSIDLFSGLRVNQAGRDLEATVLKHMDRLRQAGIVFSCITVLEPGQSRLASGGSWISSSRPRSRRGSCRSSAAPTMRRTTPICCPRNRWSPPM